MLQDLFCSTTTNHEAKWTDILQNLGLVELQIIKCDSFTKAVTLFQEDVESVLCNRFSRSESPEPLVYSVWYRQQNRLLVW